MQASLAASLTRTAPLRAPVASKPRGRVAMRAFAYDKKSKGKPSLVGVIKVPKHFEHEMDALVVSHEAHMHDTHVVYNGQEPEEGMPRFLEYYVTKINEVEDPLDATGARRPPIARCELQTQKALFRIPIQSTSARKLALADCAHGGANASLFRGLFFPSSAKVTPTGFSSQPTLH